MHFFTDWLSYDSWTNPYRINPFIYEPRRVHSFLNWLDYNVWYGIDCFFAAPLGGSPQPLLPFLSTFFVGGIIGLYLEQEKPPKRLPGVGMIVGGVLIIAGLIFGLVLNARFEDWLPLRYPERLTKLEVWQPWYLFGLGGQLIFFMLLLRLVEYRGKAASFAKRTKFVRRFGIIPFTIYNFQWIELLPRWIFTGLILGIGWTDSDKVSPLIYLLMLAYIIGLWYLVTWAWEKVNYVGSFEWIISRITLGISKIGIKRKEGKERKNMGTSKRNMGDLVNNVNWINLSHIYEEKETKQKEKRLLLTSSILGIICFPFIITSLLLFDKNNLKKIFTKENRFSFIVVSIIVYSIVQFLSISIYLLTWKGISI
jgi:hypothetical protein